MITEPYDGDADAEKILKEVMKRDRWGARVRDELAKELEAIIRRDRNRKRSARGRHPALYSYRP